MRTWILPIVLGLALTACKAAGPSPVPEPAAKTPSAGEAVVVDEIFGHAVADPERWLEDVKAESVQSWMSEQDKLARDHLAKLPAREALKTRLTQLYYVDSVSVPVVRKNNMFFERQTAQIEKGVLYWQQREKGKPVELIDPNKLSDDGSTSLGVWVPSPDGKRLAYALKENNMDEATLYVMDVATQKKSDIDVIPGAKYAEPEWTKDGSGFFYTWLPTDPSIEVSERPGYAEVRFHRLGTDPKSDVIIHDKLGDPTRFIWPEMSEDGRFLFITIWYGWSQNDLYFRELGPKTRPEDAVFRPDNGWTELAKGRDGHFEVEAFGGKIYVSTNEGAPRLALFEVDPKKPEREHWKSIVAEQPDAVLTNFSIVGGKLVVGYMKNATSEIRVVERSGKPVRTVKLPALGTASKVIGNADADAAYFSFSSFTYPQEVYRTSIKTAKTEVFAKVEVPMNPSDFQVDQVWYTSKDGTKVSMFVVGKKGYEKNGRNPTLLYGYGGFNVSLTPWFASRVIPWLEKGGLYAVPNLRGGGEYGEAWHRAGMLHNKQNVFDDFIAAAEHLIQDGYTSSAQLAIAGRSNGGLLVGAAMTQRPDLFRAVVCGVPLLDMVRYHLFGSGKTWIPEYGDPEKKEDFEALLGYSPYHQVKPTTVYPALLMASADSDDRVDPMHARKFVAAIQSASAGQGPYLLRIERNSGHGGADMRKAAVAQFADELAFLIAELGVP